MSLPYELTGFPNSDVAALRRLAAGGNPDVLWLLSWVNQILQEIRADFDDLEEELVSLESQLNGTAFRNVGGRPAFGERKGEMEVVARILKLRKQKKSFRAIAQELNSRRIPSAGGKRWQAQTVSNVIQRHG